MNKNKLKSYAPQARLDFIEAVKSRAALLGISASGVSSATKQGDVVIVEGREWPAKVGAQRERLAAKIAKEGFEAVMDRVAYTWFNRFAALRYMELHDYLGHGHRVLSNAEGTIPEILAHAHEVDLPGLDREKVVELRLAGNRDGDLYRMVLVAQCNALSSAMPFLFERIDDESELLLPDNLLRTDSVIAKMVSSIDEEDWREVEIIGWLYQFYISERKDQVIGDVVRSEDIPAATQLFTPNWIVKYLVQNSVGRLWLLANGSSGLRTRWEYLTTRSDLEEASPALQARIAARLAEDGGKLNPESIRVVDPACGSGHILVEVYDVLKEMYLERGYQPRAVPRLILEKNIFGLDIDERAAQISAFALCMKARADDRRLFSDSVVLNITAIRDTKGLPLDELATHLGTFDADRKAISLLLHEFEDAKTVGSLLVPSAELVSSLPALTESVRKAALSGDVFAQAAADDLLPIMEQARFLSGKFDVVVANPPYMGGKGMNATLKEFAKDNYPLSKQDLFAMFIERGFLWLKSLGFNSMVTMQSWMFLSSFESLRKDFLENRTITSMAHLGARAFSEISGEVVQTVAFQMLPCHIKGFRPVFFRLVDGNEEGKREALLKGRQRYDSVIQDDFSKIPGAPVAYWVSNDLRKVFDSGRTLGEIADVKQGLATADNGRFLRYWPEVSLTRSYFDCKSAADSNKSGKRWFPHSKGGEFRKWYGNRDWLVNWENDGYDIRNFVDHVGRVKSRPQAAGYYFREGLTWSLISGNSTAFRLEPVGNIIGHKGPGIFADHSTLKSLIPLLNSKVAVALLKILSPTLGFEVGQVAQIPVLDVPGVRSDAIELARLDWDSFETSWEFLRLPWVQSGGSNSVERSWGRWAALCDSRIQSMREIEEHNNSLLIRAYGLEGELLPSVADDEITLARADREADCKRLISYAVGCMMGRYSLDELGLIYADAGNSGFDSTRYKIFPADSDGIVPVTDGLWFEDEAALRVSEFVKVVWGAESHEENMAWLAESLGAKNGETPEETVRRYLATSFYKDHLQTYKKRPIYWLFTSGKQGAFGALVYLHRYHEGTLSRMRSEYVVPLMSKYLDRIEMLQRDAEAATSAAARTKIQKRIDGLRKQHHELVGFEERLRHLADSRIALDLDDGVKANYGKFGELLAETKAITGGSEE